MRNIFKKKYRVKEVTKGKIKLYFPQSGRVFYSNYSTYVFGAEETARQFIRDRMQEEFPESIRFIDV